MLSYALAIAVATSSLVLFLTAFLMSDIHRKDDFLWSGVGLIYALVLWYCARNITGAVLLGQAAATALLVSYSWQTLKLRRAIANPDKAAEINQNNFSLLKKITGLLKRDRPVAQTVAPSAAPSVETPSMPKVTEQEIAIPDTPAKDTVQTPAPSAVPQNKKVSAVESPVTESATTEDTVVNTEPNLSETKELSSKVQQDKQAFNAEATSSQSSQADTLDRDTKIVKPQPVKPKTVVEDNRAARSPESTKNVEATPVPTEAKAKTKEPADTTTGDRPEAQSLNKGIKPESQTTTEKTEPAKVKPATKSSLDSLETVEVAEVLEAPEDATIDLDTDRSNIIEVTTTEINITTEIQTLEQKQKDDLDSEEK